MLRTRKTPDSSKTYYRRQPHFVKSSLSGGYRVEQPVLPSVSTNSGAMTHLRVPKKPLPVG
jgi:hypothetical protein